MDTSSTWTIFDNSNSAFPAGARVNYQAMAVDAQNQVWVGTTKGLVRFYTDTAGIQNELLATSTIAGFPNNNVKGIDFDDQEAIWLATDAGIVKMSQPKCKAGFVASPTFCEMDFNACASAVYPDSIISFHWDFGDPSSGSTNTGTWENGWHTFSGPGTFEVTFVIETAFGCKDTLIQEVEIPEKKFTADTVCLGAQTTFETDTIEEIISYTWAFGDGTVSTFQNPKHQFLTPGVHDVQLTWSDGLGCVDSITQEVLVDSLPIVSVNSPGGICSGGSAQLTASGGEDYAWEPTTGLSNPNTQSPTATPSQSTDYTVTVTDVNGCKQEATVSILVDASTEAQIFYIDSFEYLVNDDTVSFCPGDSAVLSATSNSLSETFSWLPDYNISDLNESQVSVWPDTTSTYQVIVQGDCGTDSAFVVVNPHPSTSATIFGPVQYYYCETDTTIQLSANPSGGTFSGPGVTDSSFSTTAAGYGGPFEILYSYENEYGCVVIDTYIVAAIYETLDSPAGLFANKLTPSSARLNWDSVESAHHYEIRGRALTVTNWTYLTVAAGSPNMKDVFGLANNISYEWQIRAFCDEQETMPSTWSLLDTFTCMCYPPDSTWTDPITSSGARLNWTSASGSAGYEIKGRRVGAPSWTAILVGNVTQRDVFGLSAGTSYEWTIRTWCDAAGNKKSDFTPLITFTTSPLSKMGDQTSLPPDVAQPVLSLFPNPTDQTVTISFENLNSGQYQLVILDVTGRLMFQGEMMQDGIGAISINLADWQAGMYFVKIVGELNLYDKLIVK